MEKNTNNNDGFELYKNISQTEMDKINDRIIKKLHEKITLLQEKIELNNKLIITLEETINKLK